MLTIRIWNNFCGNRDVTRKACYPNHKFVFIHFYLYMARMWSTFSSWFLFIFRSLLRWFSNIFQFSFISIYMYFHPNYYHTISLNIFFAILISVLFLTLTQAYWFATIYYNVWYEIIALTNMASISNCENNHL